MRSLIVLFDLRRAGFYIAVSFVVYDDDAVRADLALGHLEGRRDRAVGEQAFSGAKRDRDYHEVQLIDKIIFEERLKHIRASHYVQIGPIRLFQLPDFLSEVSIQKDCGLPIA